MSSFFALYIWTVVGVADARGSVLTIKYDWRNIGEFGNNAYCEKAATKLGIKPELFRCVEMGRIR